jgi:hypothetical protein
VLTFVARTPFPAVPGADALDMPVWADGRHNEEPVLFMAALEDIAREAGKDARPLAFKKAMGACTQASELGRRDMGAAPPFTGSGLRYFSVDDDGSVGRWTLNGAPIATTHVVKLFWSGFRAAVLAGLNDSQEMASAAHARIRSALAERRAEEANSRDAEVLAYVRRSSWSVPVAVRWIAQGYVTADDLMEAPEEIHLLLSGDVEVLVWAATEGLSADLGASNPFEKLMQACAATPGLLKGRAPGSHDFGAIDVSHLELGGFHFEGAGCSRARSGDVTWSDVCIQRELLWLLHPPPAVTIMRWAQAVLVPPAIFQFVRLVFAAYDQRAQMLVADLFSLVRLVMAYNGTTQLELASPEAASSDETFRAIMDEVRAYCDAVPKKEKIYLAHALKAARRAGYRVGSKRETRVRERVREIYGDRVNDRGAPRRR